MTTLRHELRQFKLLVRTFWTRFFDNELVSPQGDMQQTVIQIVALLAAPGPIISLLLMFKYAVVGYRGAALVRVASWADKALFLTFSMVAIGFLTVISWEALFPDRRDAMILTPLPLKGRTMFASKLAALLLYLLVFAAAINLVTAVVFPLVASPYAKTLAVPGRQMLAHLLSTLAACAFVFFVLLALEGLLISVLPHRQFQRVSALVQLACLFSLLGMLFLVPEVSSLKLLTDSARIALLKALPPVWFLGLYEVMQGGAQPVFGPLAVRAVCALGLSAGGALLIYAFCYRRRVRRLLESAELVPRQPGRLARWPGRLANRILVRRPAERACFHFILKTMTRSRRHRLFLAGYLGVGMAYVADGLVRLVTRGGSDRLFQPSVVMLSAPLVLAFFVLVGLRVLFAVPAELRANWIFQVTESDDRRPYLAAVRKAVLVVGVAPLIAVGFPTYAVLWGWSLALKHALYCLLLSLLLMEGLLLGFFKIPFTCSYLPGKANLKVMWPFYWIGFSLYAFSMAALEARLLRAPVGFTVFVIAAVAGLAALAIYRRRLVRDGIEMVYEEEPDPAVRTLDLRDWPAVAAR